jgi:t-SNARE complex subunit (syntaxin)
MSEFSSAIKQLVALSRQLKQLVGNHAEHVDTQQWFADVRAQSAQFERSIETFRRCVATYNKRALRKSLSVLGLFYIIICVFFFSVFHSQITFFFCFLALSIRRG